MIYNSIIMFPVDSLVLYKGRPARVTRVGDKISIELENGSTARVRPKDVQLLHPGPVDSLHGLSSQTGEVVTAWELLVESGPGSEPLDLATLAELAFGRYSPETAWAAWEHLADGLHFSGGPEAVTVHTPGEVSREKSSRAARAAEAQAWEDFLARQAAGGPFRDEDRQYWREVEDLALGRRSDSRVLAAIGRKETPQSAHALLLEAGVWDPSVNPYPVRFHVSMEPPDVQVSALSEEDRLDLTHLEAYAIDDSQTQDPDDALSLEGELLWVHVADVAARVPPDSPADQEARARGASLYLPEGMIPMLPFRAVESLGLGLQEISPALSFGLSLNEQGEVEMKEITPSWVRVQRTTYAEVDAHIDRQPFAGMYRIAQAYQARRAAQGALFIDLPEAHVRVRQGQVEITPLPTYRSRDVVREAMLMAGEATARYAAQQELPFPYASQDPPRDGNPLPDPPQAEEGGPNLAAHFAVRRFLNPSRDQTRPAPHAGLGLPEYSRVTSPLRRYLDLVAHQQLRAHLRGQAVLSEATLVERVGAAEAASRGTGQTEGLARRHWTLVYFLQNPSWRGEGVVVDRRGRRARLLIPELAFETNMHLGGSYVLNARVRLEVKEVNLANLEAYLRVI